LSRGDVPRLKACDARLRRDKRSAPFPMRFERDRLQDISEAKVQELLQHHHLETNDLQSTYYESPRQP